MWACVREDREEMLEQAREGGEMKESGTKGPVPIARETEVRCTFSQLSLPRVLSPVISYSTHKLRRVYAFHR